MGVRVCVYNNEHIYVYIGQILTKKYKLFFSLIFIFFVGRNRKNVINFSKYEINMLNRICFIVLAHYFF